LSRGCRCGRCGYGRGPDGAHGGAEGEDRRRGGASPTGPIPGTPFRPVELDGLQIIPWLDSNGSRPRVMFALRASGMRSASPLPARRSSGAAA